jgi:hypothetical protein
MNMRTLRNAALYTGAFLLFATLAIAQSSKNSNPAPEKATLNTTGTQTIDELAAAPANRHPAASPSHKTVESEQGSDSIDKAPTNDRNELDQLSTPRGGAAPANKNNQSSRLLYEAKDQSGNDPLLDNKDRDRAAHSSMASVSGRDRSHATVEYKDPEDTNARYRPGNNKISKTDRKSSSTTSNR